VNTSESPAMRQRPATRGVSIGAGEDGYTGADRVTVSGWAPSAIVLAGSFASRVAGSDALVGVGEEGALGVLDGVGGEGALGVLGAGPTAAIAGEEAAGAMARGPVAITLAIMSHRPARFMHAG
jgi:hypothetical protein